MGLAYPIFAYAHFPTGESFGVRSGPSSVMRSRNCGGGNFRACWAGHFLQGAFADLFTALSMPSLGQIKGADDALL